MSINTNIFAKIIVYIYFFFDVTSQYCTIIAIACASITEMIFAYNYVPIH